MQLNISPVVVNRSFLPSVLSLLPVNKRPVNKVSLNNVMADTFHKIHILAKALLHGLNGLEEIFPMQFRPDISNSICSIIASLFGGIADTFFEVVLRSMSLNPRNSDGMGPFVF